MMSDSEARAALLALLREKSVFHGDFILASGAHSKYYIDCRLTTLDARGACLVGQVMRALIRRETAARKLRVEAVGGLTLGADPIALATAMTSYQAGDNPPLRAFVVRKAAKEHGKGKQIEGNFQPGDSVVVIEDSVTSGGSAINAINAIEKEGGKVALVAALVDRLEGGRAKIEALGHPFAVVFTKEQLL
jgi:orotate phosphoribosyltransferase